MALVEVHDDAATTAAATKRHLLIVTKPRACAAISVAVDLKYRAFVVRLHDDRRPRHRNDDAARQAKHHDAVSTFEPFNLVVRDATVNIIAGRGGVVRLREL